MRVADRQRRRRSVLALVAVALAGAGCGSSDDDYANNPRPPKPINVTAAITDQRISVSPRSFGAGPVVLIVANQTNQSQQVTIETDTTSGKPGITESTGPINPDGTATIKVDLPEGDHVVSVDDGEDIRPANVEVGPMRPSAQDDLLQP